jgi:hypothetical protein
MSGGAIGLVVVGVGLIVVAKPFASYTVDYMNRAHRPPYGAGMFRTITWTNRLCGVFAVVLGLTTWIKP